MQAGWASRLAGRAMSDSTAIAAPNKVAIVLALGLPPGPATNIASCIAAGLAASEPRGWAGRPLIDASGLKTVASSHLPITILGAELATMRVLMQLTTGSIVEGGAVSLFPAYAQAIHECSDYWHSHGLTAHVEEAMLGIGFSGPKRWVNRMTGSLPLWR